MSATCLPPLPYGTHAWAAKGRYAGLQITLLRSRADLTTYDDPHGERPDSGFYVCRILLPESDG